jgi:TIR domain
MGYLPQYKHDLFLSYRRVANELPDRWIDRFRDGLERKLRELVGEIEIYRDEDQIHGGEGYREKIDAALDSAAIFLAVISRTYLDSDECVKELDRFLGRLKQPGAQRDLKIVPIFKQPTKPDQVLPEELREIHHHDFFQWEHPGSPRFLELGPDGQDTTSRIFWETLNRVAQDLMFLLEEMRDPAKRPARGKVFLARVSDDLRVQREQLRTDLRQRGFLVVPEREYLWNTNDCAERIADDLKDALVSVHLVSDRASQDREVLRSRLQLEQAHRAMKAAGRPTPMIWIQPGDGGAQGGGALVDFIESDLANDGIEYWRGGLEEFKSEIYKKLPAPPRPPQESGSQRLPVLVEEGDIELLGALMELLVNTIDAKPVIVKWRGAAPNDPARLANALSACSRALLVWGKQPEEWLEDLLEQGALQPYLGKERLGIWVAAPATAEKQIFQTRAASTLRAAAGGDEAILRGFLALSARPA